MRKVAIREQHIESSLVRYPELIDGSLFGITQGMAVLGKTFLVRQDTMPNGRQADMVFVQPHRITVVEVKKCVLRVHGGSSAREDVVDQIADYLRQCRIKYPDIPEYRGFIVATGIREEASVLRKISKLPDIVRPLVLGRDIPTTIKLCASCFRAVEYWAPQCHCGHRFR